ncbi:hypothetical protein D3C78_1527290 [compost metagenome]
MNVSNPNYASEDVLGSTTPMANNIIEISYLRTNYGENPLLTSWQVTYASDWTASFNLPTQVKMPIHVRTVEQYLDHMSTVMHKGKPWLIYQTQTATTGTKKFEITTASNINTIPTPAADYLDNFTIPVSIPDVFSMPAPTGVLNPSTGRVELN